MTRLGVPQLERGTWTIIVPVPFAQMEPLDEEIIALETWSEREHDIIILEEDDGEIIIVD